MSATIAERLAEVLYGGPHPGRGVEVTTHEAGHALAAVLLGASVNKAELMPADRRDLAGVVSWNEAEDAPCGPLRAAKGHLQEAAVVLAGPLAAAQRWGIEVKIGKNDRRQFDSAVSDFRRKAPVGFRHEAGEVAARIEASLRDMLYVERQALDAMTVALARKGRLSGAEVESLVRDHRARPARDWATALELALR